MKNINLTIIFFLVMGAFSAYGFYRINEQQTFQYGTYGTTGAQRLEPWHKAEKDPLAFKKSLYTAGGMSLLCFGIAGALYIRNRKK